MSCASEIDAIAYDSMTKRCAEQAVELEVLKQRLQDAERRVAALTSVKSYKSPPTQWRPREDNGMSRRCHNAIDQGLIGEYSVSSCVLDELVDATRGRVVELAREDMLYRLWMDIIKIAVVQEMRHDSRTRSVIQRASVVVGVMVDK